MKPSPGKMIIVFIGAFVMSFVLFHIIVLKMHFLNTIGITGGLMAGFIAGSDLLPP